MPEKKNLKFNREHPYTKWQLIILVCLRVLIGWHFLYEGLSKLLNPYWSSGGYLSESKWIFSGLFKAILNNPGALSVVDFLNTWGLILIGAGLIAGLLTRAASISGVALLFLYYICNPPFVGYQYSLPAEGSYLFVNKILIEMFALWVVFLFPTGKIIGLDMFFKKREKE